MENNMNGTTNFKALGKALGKALEKGGAAADKRQPQGAGCVD